jgi:hypothetical protein
VPRVAQVTDAPSPVHAFPNADQGRPQFLMSFKACVSCSSDGYSILKSHVWSAAARINSSTAITAQRQSLHHLRLLSRVLSRCPRPR